MLKLLEKIPSIFVTVLLAGIYGNSVQAQVESNKIINQIQQYTKEAREDSIEQITNVDRLRDVSPTDWSYEALRNLSDRYGCISGFPDGTFKGDRPITRNEFAAGLNSCFEQIERSINSSQGVKENSLIRQELIRQKFLYTESVEVFLYGKKDNDQFIREFPYGETELKTLGGKVDELENLTRSLEDNQFSPTTKLTGETIFSFSNTFEGF